MSIPINKMDYERFKKLADLIYEEKENVRTDEDKSPTCMDIYVSGGYLKIEMTGTACTPEKIMAIMESD
jgi:hypothetical protein